MNEESLVPLFRRVAEGDGAAMEQIYELAKWPLIRFFYRLSRSSQLAEDLLQNTFLSLWRYRHNFAGAEKTVTYLYTVSLNEWRNYLAREMKQKNVRDNLAEEFEESVDLPASRLLEDTETRHLVQDAVASLPRLQREAFILHRFEGLSCREIADVYHEPLKTIESRLRLALQKLTYKLRLHEGLT